VAGLGPCGARSSGEAELLGYGAIRGIDPKIDPASRLVNVRAEVANPEGRLTPGQFVEVRVELPRVSDVLSLPQTAVVTSLYGDYVFVVRPAKDEGGAANGGEQSETSSTSAVTPAEAQDGNQAAQKQLVVNQVFVKLGRRSGGRVEIVEGLSAGDQVVSAGQNRLTSGMPVVVATENDEAAGEGTQAGAQ
jgi:membrane fusion protein (multidrug efflux system)